MARWRRQAACCGASFADAAAHRSHFRCDWHRYNLKARVRGLPQLPEASFDALPAKARAAVLDAED